LALESTRIADFSGKLILANSWILKTHWIVDQLIACLDVRILGPKEIWIIDPVIFSSALGNKLMS